MSSPATKEFIPTTTYRAPSSIPRAWYHGHSEKATQTLSKLTHVSAVVSVRDMRIPLTSWNPTIDKDMLVSDANNRRRLIVYSKKDLCRDVRRLERRLCELHEKTDPGSDVFFFHERGPESEMHRLMSRIRELCVEDDSLTRSQVVITGLPNVGKSTLVNRMARCRLQGDKLQGIQREGRRNPAETGAQPGVTKHVQKQGIRIGLGQDDSEEAGSVEVDGLRSRVYAVDTPGIGVKYIPDGEEYLKLALCHSVGTNQGSLTHEVLAEYLLFRMNLHDPKCYSRYCSVPTNNVDEFLDAVRTSTGKRDDSHAAAFVVSKWREGRLGRFALDDDLSLEAFETRRARVLMGPMSGNAAWKQKKARARMNANARHGASKGDVKSAGIQ
jgi:ribosome biogenesis GTPase A